MNIRLKTFLGILIAIPLSILWLLWDMGFFKECDRTDYSPIIKKVAVPMQQELEKFYKENKRFPTTKERNKMLEKVGCSMEENDCIYERENGNTSLEN